MNKTDQLGYVASKESKLLIAALVFCLAGWVWFNFFTQKEQLAYQRVRSQAGVPTVNVVPAANSGAVNVPVPVVPNVNNTTSFIGTPPELSEVEIMELPFLSSSPLYTPPVQVAEDGNQVSEGTARPTDVSSAAINPFAPLITPPEEDVADNTRNVPPAPSRTVTRPTGNTNTVSFRPSPVVPVATGPKISSDVRAPAPSPLSPPPSFATSLPRSLGRGGLASLPRVLTNPTGAAELADNSQSGGDRPKPTAPDNLAQLVAVVRPGVARSFSATTTVIATSGSEEDNAESVEARPTLPTVASNAIQRVPSFRATTAQEPPPPPPEPAVVESPEPVESVPSVPSEPVPPPAPAVAAIPAPMPTVEVVRNPLDVYLEDNNLLFTGAVLGPVSIGVFQANGQSFHIATGRQLPDTDIILTNVTSEQAQVTLAGETRTLSLNPSLSARAREATN